MSFPYKRILCAVAFDDNSDAAINEAAALSRASGGAIVLLHVVWINPLAADGYVLADLEKSQIEDARTKLEAAAKRALSGIRYEVEIRIGDPGEEILAAGQRFGADLTVMATHGRHGVSRLMLGSVAERVVRSAAIPVLTVRRPT